MKSAFKNIRSLGVRHKIIKSPSLHRVFFDFVLPKYEDTKSFISSRPYTEINLRPVELLGLCIASALASYLTGIRWTPASDPLGYDGSIIRLDQIEHVKKKRSGMLFEQTFIPDDNEEITQSIINSIDRKLSKGVNYTENINLLILSEKNGEVDQTRLINYVQASNLEYCSIFFMQEPRPFKFNGAILKSPADELGIYHVNFNSSDEGVETFQSKSFIPIEKIGKDFNKKKNL